MLILVEIGTVILPVIPDGKWHAVEEVE